MDTVNIFKVTLTVRYINFFQVHWWLTSLMQQRELMWTFQDAHSAKGYILGMCWNHNVHFEKCTHTVADFPLNHNHERNISTLRLNCLIKYSVCFGDHTSTGDSPGDFPDVKINSVTSPDLKTVFIFNQSFCYTIDDETACVLYSQCCQDTMIVKTLDQWACDWKYDSSHPCWTCWKYQWKCKLIKSICIPQQPSTPVQNLRCHHHQVCICTWKLYPVVRSIETRITKELKRQITQFK